MNARAPGPDSPAAWLAPAAGDLWSRYDHTLVGRAHRWLRTPPDDINPDFRDFYALSNYTHALGLFSHLLFLVLFSSLALWFHATALWLLAAANVLSIGIFCATLGWSKRGAVNLALLIGGLEVAAHQNLAVYVLGLDPAFQHYILILAVGTLFYRHIPLQVRIGMAILPILGYIALTILALHLQPLYVLPPVIRDALAAMNVVFFVVILMGICIYFQYSVEQARVLAEKMARSKTLFLANMSHELRTPLNAILGFAQILRRSDALTDQDRRNLATIDRSGEHLLDLINDILDMSKLEEGKLDLQQAPIDLGGLLDDVIAMFTLAARDKGLALHKDLAPGLPQWIRADALRLRQVLVNLLGNALKFTDHGSVRLSVVAAGTASDGRSVLRFAVSDTGGGIAKDELGDLFQLFMQTELGRRSRKGTGLGLALSKRFVELMGGRIGVDSELGKGSTFRFEIPVTPASAPETAADSANARPSTAALPAIGPRRRMLVVDDNAENRDVLLQLLGGLGCEVAAAADGAAGVAQWRSFAPDLTWMDLRMPVMDGFDACRAILDQARADGRPAPRIVAITASSLETGRALMEAAGFAAWVGKPFRESEIHAILHRHLGMAPPPPPAGPTPTAPTASPTAPAVDLAARVAALTPARRDALLQAATRADFDALQSAIAALAADEPALAARLSTLLDQYRFDLIQDLLSPPRASAP